MYRIFKVKKGRERHLVSSINYEIRRVGYNFHFGVVGRKVYHFSNTFSCTFVADMRFANFTFSKLDKSMYKFYNRELFFSLVNGYFSKLIKKCDFYKKNFNFKF